MIMAGTVVHKAQTTTKAACITVVRVSGCCTNAIHAWWLGQCAGNGEPARWTRTAGGPINSRAVHHIEASSRTARLIASLPTVVAVDRSPLVSDGAVKSVEQGAWPWRERLDPPRRPASSGAPSRPYGGTALSQPVADLTAAHTF